MSVWPRFNERVVAVEGYGSGGAVAHGYHMNPACHFERLTGEVENHALEVRVAGPA